MKLKKRRVNPRMLQVPKLPHKSCPKCSGRGRIIKDGERGQHTRECPCVFKGQVYYNMKFTWPYMLKIMPVDETPLLELIERGTHAYVVASQPVLASHLKCMIFDHLCNINDPHFWIEVRSDKDIVDAWLKTAKILGEEIYDADVALAPVTAGDPQSIKELAMRADLMIIQLGKKVAPNKETHSTFIEAVEFRIDNGLTTWIVQHPNESVEDLLVYSDKLVQVMEDYDFEEVALTTVPVIGASADEHRPTKKGVYEVAMNTQLTPPASRRGRGRVRPSMSSGVVGEKVTTDVEAEEAAKEKAERDKAREKRRKAAKKGSNS